MPKEKKSNKEAKKKPQLTLLEKRAAKKNKDADSSFLQSKETTSQGSGGAKRN